MTIHTTTEPQMTSEPLVVIPKQARSRRTREKIIEAAIELFEQRGFEKTTSNDIAAAAGVSIGSFYVYFTDKRQVLLLAIERLISERIDAVFSNFRVEDLSTPHLRQAIRQAVARAFMNKCLTPGLNRVIQEMAGKDDDIALLRREHFARSIRQLRNILEVGQQAGLTNPIDLEIASTLINHTVDALACEYVLTENRTEKEREAMADALTDMIFRYVFKPLPSQTAEAQSNEIS